MCFRSSCSCGPRCLIAWMRRHRCFGWRDDFVGQVVSTTFNGFCSISAPTSSWRNDPIWRIFFKYPPPIVDGRNPAPVDMVNIPLFIGFYTSQVVQDFFHQQLVFRRQKHKGEGIDITEDLDHFFKIPPASNVGIFGFPYRIAAWCSRRYPPAHCRHQMIQVGRILTLMLWRIWLENCCFFSCEMCGSAGIQRSDVCCAQQEQVHAILHGLVQGLEATSRPWLGFLKRFQTRTRHCRDSEISKILFSFRYYWYRKSCFHDVQYFVNPSWWLPDFCHQ